MKNLMKVAALAAFVLASVSCHHHHWPHHYAHGYYGGYYNNYGGGYGHHH